MPRWRELPEELDPVVCEFTGRLRALVEHSGMSLVAVADRTGYSKGSWERYLNGRLLPPRDAVEALAGAMGADVSHLGAMWELAERAWSRSEMWYGVTTETIGVARARAALAEFEFVPPTSVRKNGRTPEEGCQSVDPPGLGPPLVPPAMAPAPRPPGPPSPSASPSTSLEPPRPSSDGRRCVALFIAGVVGALLVIAGALVLIDPGGGHKRAQAQATAPATTAAALPSGVRCAGEGCVGKDPQAMGCGASARTTAHVTVGGAYVEVRYSETCRAAWARITRAAPGGEIRVSAPARDGGRARTQGSEVGADGEAYTRMIPVDTTSRATACTTLTSGKRLCTPRAARG